MTGAVLESARPALLNLESESVLDTARRAATARGGATVSVSDLLVSLLAVPTPTIRILLSSLRADPTPVMAELIDPTELARLRTSRGRSATPPLPLDNAVDAVIQRARREADEDGSAAAGPRHLLLAAIAEGRTPAVERLEQAGLTAPAIRGQLPRARVEQRVVRTPVRGAIRPSPIFIALAGAWVLCGVGLALVSDGSLLRPLVVLFIMSGWLVALCLHEFGHALAGYLGGDRSTAARGALSLDPRHYTNPLLTIVLPLFYVLAGFLPLPGGSVWIDKTRITSRRWRQLVALGGPLATLGCLLLVSAPFLLGIDDQLLPDAGLWTGMAGLAEVLAISLVLNLLPVPPLDGFHLIAEWLPPGTRQAAFRLGWMPMLALFAILWMPGPFSDIFWVIGDHVTALLRVPDWLAWYALDMLRLSA